MRRIFRPCRPKKIRANKWLWNDPLTKSSGFSEESLDFRFLLRQGEGQFFFFFLPMTKADMVNAIAAAAGITKKAASSALEAVVDIVTGELKKGENVTITGFGTFRVSKRAARTGVNPRNPSEKIKIPAMKIPVFKAGKALKDAVR